MAERSSFFKKFNEEFEKLLPDIKNYQTTFHSTSDSFEKRYGIAPYSSWDSFKSQRSKRSRNNKK